VTDRLLALKRTRGVGFSSEDDAVNRFMKSFQGLPLLADGGSSYDTPPPMITA
jgi:hypothetical protein